MARIRLKLGENEIEIDSRDFYVDNHTLKEVVGTILHYMPKNQAKITYDIETVSEHPQKESPPRIGLEYLDDAEVNEPEFVEPTQGDNDDLLRHITAHEIKSKLQILETNRFFASPRTVTETVECLSEHGWIADPLDVSMTLASMTSTKEMMKHSHENKIYYFIGASLLTH